MKTHPSPKGDLKKKLADLKAVKKKKGQKYRVKGEGHFGRDCAEGKRATRAALIPKQKPPPDKKNVT